MDEQRQYVGIDLHRRRSVILRMAADGSVLETVRIKNDLIALAGELAKAGPAPEVAMEATLGWYWAADVIGDCGARLHLAHPLGIRSSGYTAISSEAALSSGRSAAMPSVATSQGVLAEGRRSPRHRVSRRGAAKR